MSDLEPIVPELGPCSRCRARPATVSALHGTYCERCYLEGAIQICEDHAARIPSLKQRLALLTF